MTSSWRLDRKRTSWILLILGLFAAVTLLRDVTLSAGVVGLVALCFFCELVDSSLGMGYGTALTPILLAVGYEPLQLVPSILASEFLSGFASSYFHHDAGNVDFSRRTRDMRIALLLALGSVVGVSVGVSLAVQVPKSVLKAGIGVIITAAGAAIWVLHKRTFTYKTWKMFALASVASFNKALSGGGYGPLMTSGQMLSGIRSKASVGITSFAEGFTCLVGVILFLGRGQHFDLNLLVPMATGALLSVPFSTEFVRHTDETKLKRLIAGVTVFLGLFTLYKVVF
jgi:uncharacterized membrane protein YfcA